MYRYLIKEDQDTDSKSTDKTCPKALGQSIYDNETEPLILYISSNRSKNQEYSTKVLEGPSADSDLYPNFSNPKDDKKKHNGLKNLNNIWLGST